MDSLVPMIRKYLIGGLSFAVLLVIPFAICLNSQLIMFGIIEESSEVLPESWIRIAQSGWIYILLGATAIGIILDLIKAYRFNGKVGLLRGSGLSTDNLTSIILDSYGLKESEDLDRNSKTEWARILVDVYTLSWHNDVYLRVKNARGSVDLFSSTLFACVAYFCLFIILWIGFGFLWMSGFIQVKILPNGIIICLLLWFLYGFVLQSGRQKLADGYHRANRILCEGLISAFYNDYREGKIERLYLCLTELSRRKPCSIPFDRDKHIDYERVREITACRIEI